MTEESYVNEVSALLAQNALEDALSLIQTALGDFPTSGKLYFLNAAVCAQQTNYDGALAHYQTALEHAPNLHIARFQQGLLYASLGSSELASGSFGALLNTVEASPYLRTFAQALIAVLNGDVQAADTLLREGIHENRENASLNSDMKKLLARLGSSASESAVTTEQGSDEVHSSDQSHLLDIYQTKH